MITHAFIPARGGSDSLPLKNMQLLGPYPLINWVLSAALGSKLISKVIVSTDNLSIRDYAEFHPFSGGKLVTIKRPPHLTDGLSYPIVEVLRDYIRRHPDDSPDAYAFFQPTSPFVTQNTITKCIEGLSDNKQYTSSQSITEVAHNNHWINQRETFKNRVDFRFPSKRAMAYNKQKKPYAYKFGNLVVTRTQSILDEGLFTSYSKPVIIHPFEAFDVDGPDDLRLANAMISGGLIP